MKTIAGLVDKCHQQFDENGTASQLLAAQLLFQRMGEVWTGAERVHDAEENPLTVELLELREIAQRTSTDFVQQVDKGLSLLGEFCGYKGLAVQARLAGNISAAVRREDYAERAYRNLPKSWRW